MTALRVLWVVVLCSAAMLAASLVLHGYRADEDGSRGELEPVDVVLAAVCATGLVAAVVATRRSQRDRGPAARRGGTVVLVVATSGLVLSVVFLPAVLLTVGAMAYALHRTAPGPLADVA